MLVPVHPGVLELGEPDDQRQGRGEVAEHGGQMVLDELESGDGTAELLGALPLVFVFLLAQRQIVEGVAGTGLK